MVGMYDLIWRKLLEVAPIFLAGFMIASLLMFIVCSDRVDSLKFQLGSLALLIQSNNK